LAADPLHGATAPGASAGTLLLASRSDDKVREIRQILAPVFRGRIITLREADVPVGDDEEFIEAFDSFLANAHAKAEFFRRVTGLPTLADDSGILVHALHGTPGVRSRRFSGSSATGLDLDRANNARLLAELGGVPPEQRGAHYLCAAVLHLLDGRRFSAIGTCHGRILESPRGTAGFGYDPIFLDPETGRSFGETDPVVKNARSHRARAFRALAANLPRLS
jgi:XTP/dITP diphosphohydrolase